VAPKDGTAFGTTSRAVPFAPLIGTQGGVSFDSTRFTWIGSANNEVSTCVAWKTSGIASFGDLARKELIIGGDGPSADGEQFARVMNALLGTRIKIVSGYPGGNAVNLAMERGEVQGRCGWSWSGVKAERRQWVDSGLVSIIIQLALSKHPELPDVPLIMDLAHTDEQKQMLRLVLARQPLGRPFSGRATRRSLARLDRCRHDGAVGHSILLPGRHASPSRTAGPGRCRPAAGETVRTHDRRRASTRRAIVQRAVDQELMPKN
jgi:hypothetical protein